MYNTLYYGDNLYILRRYIPNDSIDLIYLDPPFKSGKDYNILFEEKNGSKSRAQIKAFEDTWTWDKTAEETFLELIKNQNTPSELIEMLKGFRTFLGTSDMMAYLVMMAIRLLELKRVLKKTGSIYLHCDPSASHYLKVLMDRIFGYKNFLNEIVWCYKTRQFSKKHWNRKHDIILSYAKNYGIHTFNWENVLTPISEETRKKYKLKDEIGYYRLCGRGIKGSPIESAKDVEQKWEIENPELVVRVYLKEGYVPEDYWFINIINQASKERFGYPTQKPESLLEKIILASSNQNEIVLDPFCGCGTTIAVAQKYKRKWIGIDITHLAITLIKRRLGNMFGRYCKYNIVGVPVDVNGAKELALKNRYEFQKWAVGLVQEVHLEDKKGADRGIDGIKYFRDSNKDVKKIIIQVKSGHVGVSQIRDLKGVIEREQAQIGVFIILEKPTKKMIEESVSSGFYEPEHFHKKYLKIQILTIEDLLNGKGIEYPGIEHRLREGKIFNNNNGEQLEL